MTAALTRAADDGEVPADSLHDRAIVIQSTLIGLLSTARITDPTDTQAGVDALIAEIERWRRQAPRSPDRDEPRPAGQPT